MKKRTWCKICLFLLIVKITFTTITGTSFKVPAQIKDQPVCLAGVICQKEEKSEYQILYLKNVKFSHIKQSNQKLNIIVYDKKFRNLSIGNVIFVRGKAFPFEGPPNPGNFDQKFYYEKQKIYFKVSADKIQVRSEKVDFIKEHLYQFRTKWHHFLINSLGEKRGGVLSAMMLGEKKDLDMELRELYQVSGIGHLLAISGLHLSFLGGGIYQLLKKAGLSYKVSGPAAVMILTIYVAMTGFSISSIRAWIMFIIRIGAEMCGRVYDPYNSLMTAALLIVLRRPLSIYDAGFLLSFGAVYAGIRVYPVLRTLYPGKNKIVEGFLFGLSITVFLLPVTLYFFYEIPLYSLLFNLIVIPLLSVLLGIGFLSSALALFYGEGACFLIKTCHVIFTIYEEICRWNLSLPFHSIVTGRPSKLQAAVYYAGLFLLLVLIEKKRKKAAWLYLFCILSLFPFKGQKGILTIQMLDVGQGDGIFIQGPEGTNYFVDGGSITVKEVGKYRIEPFLKCQGMKELDYVFISHGDIDHLNGIEEMLQRQRIGIRIHTLVMPTKKVWDPAMYHLVHTALENHTKVVTIKENEKIEEGEFSLTCLFPDEKEDREAGNESSMVLYADYKNFQMLFTGDLEGRGEEALLKKEIGQIDVLKVAHHGSKNSTEEELLEKWKPKIGLISAGRGNPYGHPHKETLKRLKKYKVNTKITMEEGCISIMTDGKKIKMK